MIPNTRLAVLILHSDSSSLLSSLHLVWFHRNLVGRQCCAFISSTSNCVIYICWMNKWQISSPTLTVGRCSNTEGGHLPLFPLHLCCSVTSNKWNISLWPLHHRWALPNTLSYHESASHSLCAILWWGPPGCDDSHFVGTPTPPSQNLSIVHRLNESLEPWSIEWRRGNFLYLPKVKVDLNAKLPQKMLGFAFVTYFICNIV